jgi:hypothetical protein
MLAKAFAIGPCLSGVSKRTDHRWYRKMWKTAKNHMPLSASSCGAESACWGFVWLILSSVPVYTRSAVSRLHPA